MTGRGIGCSSIEGAGWRRKKGTVRQTELGEPEQETPELVLVEGTGGRQEAASIDTGLGPCPRPCGTWSWARPPPPTYG